MGFGRIFGISSIISFLILWVMAFLEESGDVNAISMYFVVFLVPIILLGLLYGLYIKYINTVDSVKLKIGMSFLPIFFFLMLALANNVRVDIIDGNLVFLGLIGTISFGITNLIWCYFTIKNAKE